MIHHQIAREHLLKKKKPIDKWFARLWQYYVAALFDDIKLTLLDKPKQFIKVCDRKKLDKHQFISCESFKCSFSERNNQIITNNFYLIMIKYNVFKFQIKKHVSVNKIVAFFLNIFLPSNFLAFLKYKRSSTISIEF